MKEINLNRIHFFPCIDNNMELFKLLIEYVNRNGVTLELNNKKNIGLYPLFLTCYVKNIN